MTTAIYFMHISYKATITGTKCGKQSGGFLMIARWFEKNIKLILCRTDGGNWTGNAFSNMKLES